MNRALAELLEGATLENFPIMDVVRLGLAEEWSEEVRVDTPQRVSSMNISLAIGMAIHFGITDEDTRDMFLGGLFTGAMSMSITPGPWRPVFETIARLHSQQQEQPTPA